MSRRDANPAVTLVKTTAEARVKCLALFALPAERTARFLSSPEMIALFIAAIVFLKADNDSAQLKMRFRAHFFEGSPERQGTINANK